MQSSFLRGSSVGHLAGVGRDVSVLSQSHASFLKSVLVVVPKTIL